jgi:hypothetical protein
MGILARRQARLGHDEDAHIDGIEELQNQIGHMTLPLLLTNQIG